VDVVARRATTYTYSRKATTTYTAALPSITNQQDWMRKPYDATQGLMLLMMGENARNMSS
jgi:hypothetical protein